MTTGEDARFARNAFDDWVAKWESEFLTRLLADLDRANRLWQISQGIDPDNPSTISVEEPLPQEQLDARAAFAARWEAIIEEGLAAGYLHDPMGEGYEVTDETTRWVQRPNPDFDPARPNPYAANVGEGATILLPREAG